MAPGAGAGPRIVITTVRAEQQDGPQAELTGEPAGDVEQPVPEQESAQ